MKHIDDFNKFTKLVREGLIQTYPIKILVKLLTRELAIQKVISNIDIEESTKTIFVKVESNSLLNKEYIKLFNTIFMTGYFPSIFEFYGVDDNLVDYLKYDDISNDFIKILNNKISNSHFTQLTIEAKYNDVVNLPKFLYHVTKQSNVKKILKIGLVSKTKSKKAYHNDRIYIGYNPIIVKSLTNEFDRDSYCLLEIDTNDLIIKLYDDPDFHKYGSYTYNNIPPKNIKIIDTFNN